MIRDFLQTQLFTFQASLGAWLADHVCDTYDAMMYDNLIRESCEQLSLEYDTYVLMPGFNYTDANLPQWTVLLSSHGRWTKVHLPNPLYQASQQLSPAYAMVTRPV